MLYSLKRRFGGRNALLALFVAGGVLATAPAAALAGAGLSATPLFTINNQTVGNTNQTGTLTVGNGNNGADVSATICRADDTPISTPGGACVGAEGLVMTPSCGAQFPNFACRPGPPSAPPSGVDPDVFLINTPAQGTGGSCVGTTFTVTRVPGSELGKYRFDPPTGTHIVLPNPGDQCVISFTFSVLRAPMIDIRPAIAGLQTAQVVEASEESSIGNGGSGIGTQTPTTVQLASPSITTNASAGILVGAGTLSDQATVSGLVNTIGTPTVTFRLYGPDNATCAGSAVFTNTQNLTLNGAGTIGTAQSANYTPTAPGVYRWIATYNGDANNNPIAGTCGLASETRTVSPPPPPPVGPPPPPPVAPPPPPPYVCTPPPGPVPPGGKLCETPPEVCTPPPGPAPAGGELCARGTAAIRGKTGCAGNPFSVVVNGRQIQRVVFALDGKVVRNLSRPNSGTRYVLKVNPRTLRTGVHRIVARTTFRRQSGTRPRVLRVTFSKCSRRASSPAFTG